MSKKSHRLAIIRNLIESESLSSQEDLMSRLREMGIEATQSTLSRDMKELKAVKVQHDTRGYAYVMPGNIQQEQSDRASSIITENIHSIEFSGNIGVIKTKPGYANAVAVLIDNGRHDDIMGTIAGDDNIFLVLRENASYEKVLDSLSSIHSQIKTLHKQK